ncbi:hypothetical protein GXW83_02435 [Streptacidiphilus sp. PB12-B1b]|uniref:hypothetical protein n=1 Tax=Streptacidiphilus sp. PB12-B1b TaxID=2705012 RepID=UPI0015FC8781|nr:hypothetical protein [Streptacidiphilus sp. PB12-B1b]QMU74800.1 hypothetical protein GXW83_02435 [Streptacidiphilus sp. PB12-B1b]
MAGVLALVVPLAGRERSLPQIATALLGGELGLHLVFCLGQVQSVTQSDGAVALNTAAGRLLCNLDLAHLSQADLARIVHASGLGQAQLSGGMPGMGGSTAGAAHAMGVGMMLTPAMFGAHLAAALLMGWLLRCGESALWRIVRLARYGAEQVTALLPLAGVLAALHALARMTRLLGLEQGLARRWNRADWAPRRLPSPGLHYSVIRRGPPVGMCVTL